MSNQEQVRFNRTGIATAGDLIVDMVAGTSEFLPNVTGDEQGIGLARGDYANESEPIGTVPPPPAAEGLLQTSASLQPQAGRESPSLLVDKLGERLAFERCGVRLYEALISKHDAFGSFEGGPARADLEHIMSEELEHYRMLAETIENMGGDPTVMTPSADLHATISKGVMEALIDPRTNLIQGLEAILVAELADLDCWHALAHLAEQAGEDALAEQFEEAEEHEAEHLARVRSWLAAAQGRLEPDPKQQSAE